MSDDTSHNRRSFLGTAAMTLAAGRLGMIGSAVAQAGKANPARSTPAHPGTHTSFCPLKQINAGVLNVGYAEDGPAGGPPSSFCTDGPTIISFVDVSPVLAAAGYRVIVPHLRGFGTTRFLSSDTVRNGQQSVVAVDIIALMDALEIKKATIAGFHWGARTANIIAALWPERCKALVSVSGYLIGNQEAGKIPLPPKAELQWWYQYYFATERGRAGYDKYRRDFSRLIWQIASPKWAFDDATFDRSAASLDNPDHVSIVIHNYRWRLGSLKASRSMTIWRSGLPRARSSRCRRSRSKVMPMVRRTPTPSPYAKKFSGKYEYRLIKGGVGHNLSAGAPQAFAKAVIDADR